MQSMEMVVVLNLYSSGDNSREKNENYGKPMIPGPVGCFMIPQKVKISFPLYTISTVGQLLIAR